MYDVLIKNGEVIDPASGLKGKLDIAISDAQIARIAQGIEVGKARRVLDVAGKLVVPGLIDLHAHIYWGTTTEGVSDSNAPPDLVGVQSGVTTLVDGGSAGSFNFGGFARYIVPKARTRLFAFLNIYRTGLFLGPPRDDRNSIDLEETIRTVESNKPLIQGIKLLLTNPALDVLRLELVRLATQAARETGTRLMVHIGDLSASPSPRAAGFTREVLGMLAPGDIVTHVCTARPGCVLDDEGQVMPELVDARERGVILDSAHGRTNFSFNTARRLIDQGIVPDTISSDVTLGGRTRVVYSLTECLGEFLALGLSIEEVIRMTTSNPAQALDMTGKLGAIAVGREADLSILEVAEGEWEFADSFGQTLRGEKAIVPVTTVRAGEVIMPEWGPHPWGWLPIPRIASPRCVQ
jgi:dihydroorotase